MPIFIALLFASGFLFDALGMTVESGPNAGEPTFPAGLLLCLMIFFVLTAILGRLEDIAVADLPLDQDVVPQ